MNRCTIPLKAASTVGKLCLCMYGQYFLIFILTDLYQTHTAEDWLLAAKLENCDQAPLIHKTLSTLRSQVPRENQTDAGLRTGRNQSLSGVLRLHKDNHAHVGATRRNRSAFSDLFVNPVFVQ